MDEGGKGLDNVTIVISILSLFVALAAVWFSSEATRRMQEAQRRFAETYLKPIKEEIDTLDRKIERVAASINELAKKFGEHSGEIVAIEKLNDETVKSVEALRMKLEALDRSIPPRYKAAPPSRGNGTPTSS